MSCRIRASAFDTQEYWDKKYSEKLTNFEWLADYVELKPFLDQHIKKSDLILMPGCGNSAISADMANDGYTSIINNDYSPVVIEQMKKLYSNLPQLQWDVMDIRKMSYPDNYFDVILDKGTIDALSTSDDADSMIPEALSEYARVLKPGCKAYIISFGQPTERLPDLNPDSPHSWKYITNIPLPREVAPHTYHQVYIIEK